MDLRSDEPASAPACFSLRASVASRFGVVAAVSAAIPALRVRHAPLQLRAGGTHAPDIAETDRSLRLHRVCFKLAGY